MKQALNILIAYLTCTDPVIQNKWLNLLHSFWHKDDGWLIKAMAVDAAGYKITVVDSDGNDVEHIISIPTIPISQEINYINGLQNALDAKVDKSAGKGLSTNDFTTTLKNKLDGLSNYVHPEFHQISEINGLQAALDNKVTVVPGKDLSSNDFTTALKDKLDALQNGISIKDENGTEQFHTGDNGLSFEGFEYDAPNKRLKSKLANASYTIDVHPDDGNDSTGKIGNKAHPFKTLTAAIASIPDFVGGDYLTNPFYIVRLLKSSTYEINSTMPRANISIESPFKVIVSFENNTNDSITVGYANSHYRWIVPYGKIKFKQTGNQYFQRLKEVDVICDEFIGGVGANTTFTASASVRITSNKTTISKTLADLYNTTTAANNRSFYKSYRTVVNVVDGIIFHSQSNGYDIHVEQLLGIVEGTGNLILANAQGDVYVNKISTAGNTVLTTNPVDATINFNNCSISGAFIKTTTWSMGNLTLKGRIKEGSATLVSGAMASGHLYLIDFYHDLGAGQLNIYAASLTMINSTLKADGKVFKNQTNITINMYGFNSIYQDAATDLCDVKAATTITIDNYGALMTNVSAIGANVTYNAKTSLY